jgi:hypothetical protein
MSSTIRNDDFKHLLQNTIRSYESFENHLVIVRDMATWRSEATQEVIGLREGEGASKRQH